MKIEKKQLRILGVGVIVLMLGVIVWINTSQPARVSFCGDGRCDSDESATSCKDDCLLSQPCLSEGQNTTNPLTACCAGLDRALFYTLPYNGQCDILNLTGGACINCGNNKCGPGENVCNCPEDCQTPITGDVPCTDSDGGNDTATWGMATGIDPELRVRTTTGDYCALADEAGNIQAVDSCSNSANPNCKLFEMNCGSGPYMAPSAVECPNGCDRGICV